MTAAYDRKGHAPGSAPGAVACVGGAIALGARRRAGDAERPRAAPSAPRPERRGEAMGAVIACAVTAVLSSTVTLVAYACCVAAGNADWIEEGNE